MTARRHILICFTMIFLLQGNWLSAQEYLDLWRNGKTDNFYLIQQKFNEYFANRDKGQGTGYKQFKRWEEFMAPRVYPSGKLINPAKLALDEELRYRGRTVNNLSRTAHTGDWQSLGITGYQTTTGWSGGMGRVNCIVPHPTDPNTLYVGTPAGGIWKTTNGGGTWTSLSDGLPVIGVSGIAINPVYTDSIYILTGDGDGYTTSSTGVLLSTNGGDSWQSTGLQWNVDAKTHGYKLLMHPTDRRILFAVTNKGIYKTSNGGVTWGDPKQTGSFTDLAFNTDDPSILYAVTSKTLYTSSDAGESWEVSSATGLPSSPGSDRIAIGVTRSTGDYVYLLFGSLTGFLGLYRSTDGGQSFSLQSDSPNILGFEIEYPFDQRSQSVYDLAIAVAPSDRNEVHIGGINCWKSIDGGTTWQYTSYSYQDLAPAGKYTHADIHALVFTGYATLYCASDGGIYRSVSGTNWTDISAGLEITQFYSISSPSTDPDIIYGGTQDNGVNKWMAPGTTMDHQLGGDGIKCVVDYNSAETVYAFLHNGNVLWVTEDGGATKWHENNGAAGGRYVVPSIMHPTDHTTLYAGYDRIYQITNLGQTFTPILGSELSGAAYVAIGMSPDNSSSMYATTITVPPLTPQLTSLKFCKDIKASTSIWSDITSTLPVSEVNITDVAVSQLNVKSAWVCFSGYSAGNKVYYTTNAGNTGPTGTTWTNKSGNLPNVPVNCITYHNNGKDGIYIGTDIGVFYTDNTMTGWIPFRNGMPNVIVKDLEITNDKIRAATYGRGIWESDLYGSCDDSYTLSGDVTGFQFFEAGDEITSTANIKGGIGTNVKYKAANIISLGEGFKVAPQSSFVASIGNCSNSPANRQSRDRQYRGVYEGVMPGALGIASVPDNTLTPAASASRLNVYPNPFSQHSTIEFYIAKPTPVTISLWDLSGKKIKVLFESASQSPGNYQVRLDAAGLRSGTYVVTLKAQDYEETKKIVIAQ